MQTAAHLRVGGRNERTIMLIPGCSKCPQTLNGPWPYRMKLGPAHSSGPRTQRLRGKNFEPEACPRESTAASIRPGSGNSLTMFNFAPSQTHLVDGSSTVTGVCGAITEYGQRKRNGLSPPLMPLGLHGTSFGPYL